MSTIAFALNTLLVCLIAFPFVIFAGATFINFYFKIKMKYEVDKGVEFINRLTKNRKAESNNAQKNL